MNTLNTFSLENYKNKKTLTTMNKFRNKSPHDLDAFFQFWGIIRLKIDFLLHTDLSYISDLPKKGNKMKQFVDEFKT